VPNDDSALRSGLGRRQRDFPREAVDSRIAVPDGRVSYGVGDLLSLLRWLNPADNPAIVEGPDDVIR